MGRKQVYLYLLCLLVLSSELHSFSFSLTQYNRKSAEQSAIEISLQHTTSNT